MRWKSLLVAGLLLAAVAAGLGFYWPFRSRDEVLKLPGIVEIHEVRLGPRVGGRVKEVFVTEGDEVQADQPLVALDVPDLEAQREILRARIYEAEADLQRAEAGPRDQEKEAARAAVTAAQARLARLVKGYREEEKKQARSELDAALADERQAIQEYQRSTRLNSQGVGSGTDLDSWRASLDRARGRVANARAKHEMHLAGSRSEDVAEAQAEVVRLQANEALLRAGTRPEEVAISRARLREARGRLEELEVNLREAVVRAAEPSSVQIVSVRKGDLVTAGMSVVRVLQTRDLWVKTYVPETDLGKLRLGQEVEVTMDSFQTVRFTGKVSHIGAESEFTPRNIQTVNERRHQMFAVRVRIDDRKGVFKSGMAAEVYLPVAKD